ncbi:LPS export ABC transporter ATP-binding protein [Candidatus Lariskella endosymbiont of Hedychridium roseum]|uniref:LPS export ABC transporter ATP-binding protein n=1 Tax=Candidatus Lariskella endosymbiont of Hedychridium roseum TaxID=3077949 RepID=UPI0030CDC18F
MLSAQHISKSYDGKKIVRNVNINVGKSEVVGLLGPNGAGKTTSFLTIAGFILPDSGDVFIDGQNVTQAPIYRRAQLGLGYLPQESSVFVGLTVAENIMAILEFAEPSIVQREKILESLLTEFSLEHIRNVRGAVLSGGERRRVEIARCLASNPKYILLDEPLAGVDPLAVEEIKQIIAKLKDKGIGILITDHNVHEMLQLVGRCYVIYDGSVLAHGTPKEIISDIRVQKLYLGQSAARSGMM